jgi:hypothetical protein
VSDSAASLPPSARRALERDIDNIEQLEVILFLHRHADRYWDAEAAAGRISLSVSVVTAALETLARRGFLDVKLTESIKYRFVPATSEQRDAIDAIAALWWTARSGIIKVLTTRREDLRDFSNAFRLGKDMGRG